MRSKKEQLEYLEDSLNQAIKMRLESEVMYRVTDTLIMSGKADKNFLAMQSKARSEKSLNDLRIRHLQDLIKQIEAGNFKQDEKGVFGLIHN